MHQVGRSAHVKKSLLHRLKQYITCTPHVCYTNDTLKRTCPSHACTIALMSGSIGMSPAVHKLEIIWLLCESSRIHNVTDHSTGRQHATHI